MTLTQLTLNLINPAGVADPSGVTGIATGHQFLNDGRVLLRVVNSASNASAVWHLVPNGTVTSGNIILTFTIQIGTNAPVTYTTAGIPVGDTTSQIAAAILAATQPNGNALSTDYPSGTVVGSGSALTSGTAVLTFGGTFANYAIPAPQVNATGVVGGGSVSANVSTAGAGNGILQVSLAGLSGQPQQYQYLLCPAGTSWFGSFLPAEYTLPTGDVTLFYDVPANYTVTAFRPQ